MSVWGDDVTFRWPWVFLAVAVVAAVRLIRWVRARRGGDGDRPAVLLGSLVELRHVPQSLRARVRGPVLSLLTLVWVVSLSIAAARPERVTVVDRTEARRNLILALDISRSMSTRDFIRMKGGERYLISRMAGVKEVVSDFLAARHDDRVGLVVFGANAFVQAPLTRDHRVVKELVERLQVGMAGDGTAIGDGLGLATKRIADLPAESRAIVLMTDGVSNSGQVTPKAAAEVAARLGVRVYAIGIGDPANVTPDGSGNLGFDEEALKFMADSTRGMYRNAQSVDGLRAVYQAISELEEQESEEPEARMVEELFPPYLTVALCAYLTALLFGCVMLRRLPE